MKKYKQLEFPYPIGPMLLEPVLTKKAAKRLDLKKFSLIDFALKDADIDYEKRI